MKDAGYTLQNHILTDAEKCEICSWTYSGDYAVYNLPSCEVMKEKQIGFINPAREQNYRAFYDGDCLIGFVNIKQEENEIFVGIGVKPELCSKGYGQCILHETYWISKVLYPDKQLYLEVRIWNKRAICCYQKAGFEIEGEPFEQRTGSGVGIFYRMIKKKTFDTI